MSEPIPFTPLGDAALDDLIRRALIVELDRQPVPSAEVWQALVARIRIEQGLLTGRGRPAVRRPPDESGCQDGANLL